MARTSSVDETQALAAALAALARPGDLVVLAGDLGAGKTAFTQGFGRALDVDRADHQPDVHAGPAVRGPAASSTTSTSTGSTSWARWPTSGLSELLDDGGVVLIEWGDAILPVLPTDYLEVRLTFGDAATTTGASWRCAASGAPVAAGRGARCRCCTPSPRGPPDDAGGRAVLILGITTSTMQVGCAIGGHEGVLA